MSMRETVVRCQAIKKRFCQDHRTILYKEMDEVFPGLYLGDRSAALNKKHLESAGITAVLNAAQGNTPSQINTHQEYYNDVHMKFLGFNLMDDEYEDIDKYFEEGTRFIHAALSSKGKVLVHCRQGISRSATFVLAYLMIYQKMTLAEAVEHVREHRFIYPNDGYIAHLLMLEDRLQKKVHD